MCFLARTDLSPKVNTKSVGPTTIILQALQMQGHIGSGQVCHDMKCTCSRRAMAKQSHLHNAGDHDAFGPGVDLVDLEVLCRRAIGAVPEGRNIYIFKDGAPLRLGCTGLAMSWTSTCKGTTRQPQLVLQGISIRDSNLLPVAAHKQTQFTRTLTQQRKHQKGKKASERPAAHCLVPAGWPLAWH